MKHKNFTTRAELLRAAADSIEMQEKAGIEPVCKYEGYLDVIDYNSRAEPWHYEFPLAVVEGRPVWEGDEIYTDGGLIFKADVEIANFDWARYSWNPPKPKTVTVELPIEYVEVCAEGRLYGAGILTTACRKALEEMK